MAKRTSLYNDHVALNARIVDFAGFDMPLNYGSQVQEHLAVRNHAGIFDVSHMHILDLQGNHAKAFLQYLLANDVATLYPGKALYSCMLNDHGGVVDDLIVYQLSENNYRLIVNAGTRDKDDAWITLHQKDFPDFNIIPRDDLSIIALQGPASNDILEPHSLKPFHFYETPNHFIARTGYTGENGYEIIVPNEKASLLWHKLLDSGAHPCGLGARDSLRLEAAFNLYGQDMDDNTSPYESNLGWTIKINPSRDFIGKSSLSENTDYELTGLILETGGILRHGQHIIDDKNNIVGTITSGGFSPSLNKSIALVRLLKNAPENLFVDIRGKLLPVKKTALPFYKKV